MSSATPIAAAPDPDTLLADAEAAWLACDLAYLLGSYAAIVAAEAEFRRLAKLALDARAVARAGEHLEVRREG